MTQPADLPETHHDRSRRRAEPDTGSLTCVVVDEPDPGVLRITLDRPEARNALSNTLRGELLAVLRDGDADPDVRVMVIRGAGPCFSSGYDLRQDPDELENVVHDGHADRSLRKRLKDLRDCSGQKGAEACE